MKLNNNQVLKLKRKKGELNLSIKELSEEVGVSRWTITKILKNKDANIHPSTADKIKNWLIDQLEI